MKKILIGILIIFGFSFNVFAERYFAEVKNNEVQRVIVADTKEWCEQYLGGVWVETFINNSSKNYAGKGSLYLPDKNDFCGEKPYPSWKLNTKNHWEAPKLMPQDGKLYRWNESIQNWDEK